MNYQILLLCFLLALFGGTLTAEDGHAASGSSGLYQVRKGDNLGFIAQKFGVTVAELRRTNSLSSDVLRIGQELRLENPFHRLKDGAVQWERPCQQTGAVLRPFGPYKKNGILMPSTGADLACAVGSAVASPAHGVVRHVGVMEGFGTLIIVEHGGGFATVLSPFDPATVAVKVGQALLSGDHLGRTSRPPAMDTPPYLHVELRRNDKAIEPDPLLK
jgi:murein DD-endopeptidase MepM/ murein hydrolase activator NlpD